MAFSNTVSENIFKTQKVMDHAFRIAKVPPQKVTREYLHTALDLLYMILSSWSNRGLALWAISSHILPMYYGKQTVPCPLGTVDVLNTNIRSLQRLEGTYTASEGTASYAFDGDIDTACEQITQAGWIAMEFEVATAITNFGILPGSSGTWDFDIEVSDDGVTWTSVYSATEVAMTNAAWYWWDVEGLEPAEFMRLKATGTTVLSVRELVFGNTPQEIPLAKINRDDYMNLPNKTFVGRPVQFFYDKQIRVPNLIVWPAPQEEYTFQQIVVTTQRYIMDPGTLREEIEIPQGGLLALITTLGYHLTMQIEEAQADPMSIGAEMKRVSDDFWAGQTDSAPVKLTPNISPYTR